MPIRSAIRSVTIDSVVMRVDVLMAILIELLIKPRKKHPEVKLSE